MFLGNKQARLFHIALFAVWYQNDGTRCSQETS